MDSATLLTDSRVRLLGPWRTSPNAGFRTGWQGSAIEVEFTGTSLSVTLARKVIDASVAYLSSIYVYIDGADPIVSAFSPNNISEPIYEPPGLTITNRYVASATPQTYVIASGLSNAPHRARIDFMEGNSYVVAYGDVYSDVTHILTDGTIRQWIPKGMLVECIGDSTAGMAGAWPNHLGIEAVTVALGGMALAGVGVAGGSKVIPPATTFYPYAVMPNYPALGSAVARTDEKCHAVMIFLGTNDIPLGYTAAAYKIAMQNLIAAARTRNGDPNLPVLMVRPMYNSDSPNYGAQLAAITAEDPNAYYYDTQPLWAAMTYWDAGTHPDNAGSRMLSSGMMAKFRPRLLAVPSAQVPECGTLVAAPPQVWKGSGYVTSEIGV